MQDRFGIVFLSCCCGASVVATTGLLLQLCRVNPKLRWRLMGRQLWYLAVSDLVFSLTSLVPLAVVGLAGAGYLGSPGHKFWVDKFCTLSQAVVVGSFATSSFVETHLALSLLASLCRSSRCLGVLRWGLFASWPVGMLAALHAAIGQWSRNDCALGAPPVYAVAVEGVCLLVSCVVYIVSYVLSRTQTFGLSVQNQVFTRASGFFVAWFVCGFPEVLRLLNVIPFGTSKLYTLSFLNLNGFANTIVYVRKSHYARRLAMRVRGRPITNRPDGAHAIYSFHVSLGQASIVSVTTIPSSAASTDASHCSADRTPVAGDRMGSSLGGGVEDDLLGCFEARVPSMS